MNQPVINCPKCEGFMEEGFIIDRGDYNIKTVSTWIAGEPIESFWSGIKTKDRSQYRVKIFRCAGCGYLESYAIEQVNDDSSIFS